MKSVVSILLVEDDTRTCRELEDCLDGESELELLGITSSSIEAFQMVCDMLPDVIILDLELHEGGGSGLSLPKALQNAPVDVHPYVIVTTSNSSAITYELARKLGADYIFSKHQDGYSPRSLVDFLRMLGSVMPKARTHSGELSGTQESHAQQQKRMVRRICAELDAIGINPKVVGYGYLVEAIQFAITDRNVSNLCDRIGLAHGKTASSVERGMQNAITRAWRSSPIDELLLHYTAKISQERGSPTLTEFIYYYANKIKNAY